MDCLSCKKPLPEGGTACPQCDHTQRLRHDPQRDRITREIPVPAAARAAGRPVGSDPRGGRGGQPGGKGVGGRTLHELAGRMDLEESAVGQDVDRAVIWLRALVRSLSRWDRRALWGISGVFLGSFGPWSYQRGLGLEAGIADYGAITAGLAAVAGAALVSRARSRTGATAWLSLQLFSVLAAACVCVWRGLTLESTPTVGLIVAGLAAAWAFTATLGTMSSPR